MKRRKVKDQRDTSMHRPPMLYPRPRIISGARNSGVPQSVYAFPRSIFLAKPEEEQMICIELIFKDELTEITHFDVSITIDEKIFRLNGSKGRMEKEEGEDNNDYFEITIDNS